MNNKIITLFLLYFTTFALECKDVSWYSFRGVDFGSVENSYYQGSYVQRGFIVKDVEEAIGYKYQPIKDDKKRAEVERLFSECRPDYIEISIPDLGKMTLSSVVTEQLSNILKSKNECSSGDSSSSCLNKKKSYIDSNKFAQFKRGRGSNLLYLSTDDISCEEPKEETPMDQADCEAQTNRYWFNNLCLFSPSEIPPYDTQKSTNLGRSPYWEEGTPFIMFRYDYYLNTFCPTNGSFYYEKTGYRIQHQFTDNGFTYARGEGEGESEDNTNDYYKNFYNFCNGFLDLFGDIYGVLN